MVKSKKGKKGAKDADTESDSEVISKNAVEDEEVRVAKDKKKSKKKKAAEADDGSDSPPDPVDEAQATDKLVNEKKENTKKEKKKKKQKKGAFDSDEDDGAVVDALTFQPKKVASKAAKFADDDDVPIVSKKATRSAFQLLDVEEPDNDDVERMDLSGDEGERTSKSAKKPATSTNSEAPAKTKSKKKKKKKADDDDEDEIDQLLAELELEYKGEKVVPAVTKKTVPEKEGEADADEEVDGEDKKKKKKKKKKKDDADDDEPSATVKKEVGTEDADDDERTMKTAAQKKKEKKERDRLKKMAEKAEERAKRERLEKQSEGKEKVVEEKVPEEVVEEEGEEEEKDDENVQDVKKSKKAEKAEKKAEKLDKKAEKLDKDKKRPGKKQLLLMQEALKKVKEEEERLLQAEEERVRLEEEAEDARIEKLRLDKERKERRKLRDKERQAKLKAEGKLLTKQQRQQKARTAATLQAFKAQGYEVPGEAVKKPFRPGTRIRPSKLKTSQSGEKLGEVAETEKESSEVVSSPVSTAEPVLASTEKGDKEEPEEESVSDSVKDAWDASSSSSDEGDEENEEKPAVKKTTPKKAVPAATKKVHIKIKEEMKVTKKPSATTDESSSDGSSDSDSDSDSEDSSESDSSEDSESDSDDSEEERKNMATRTREKAMERIRKRKEEAEKNRAVDNLRSPIVCVLGHVDTGKTKILDKIRHTNVQDGEAGGITQQIGATMVPMYAIEEQSKMVKNFGTQELKVPGLLIIDTPGHESFSNLRSRGSSLCDIAILVVDIMHGIEPQTLESINLLKSRKTPFIVALNKIDRLYDWKVTKNKDFRDIIRTQSRNTQLEFEQRTKEVILQFSEQGLNAALFYENTDVRTYVSLVPTSATTGEGMGNLLALVVELTQNMLSKRLAFSEDLQATVLELKALPGLGTTIDVILVNGRLHEGDTMVLAGMDGPVVTQIRSLLMPQPLKELRVKNPYQEFKEVQAAQGIKITAKDLEKVVAGLNLVVAQHPDEVEILKEEVTREFHSAMSSIKLAERGVYVQASTLGSLEALLEFLRTSKIPYSGIRIGPVVKRDVMKASIMLEHDGQFAVILAFDVKIERDAQELADSLGVRIFAAPIIYHLFDHFTAHREQLRLQKREEVKHLAVFPCKLRILPQFIFNSRDPIVLGVSVEAGVVKEGTPICVPSQEFLEIGIVTTIEINHKQVDVAKKGQEVCIKIEPIPGDSPKMYGRHFEATDILVSKITRQSIDVCKDFFRDDLSKTDWQLMIELKKLFQIL